MAVSPSTAARLTRDFASLKRAPVSNHFVVYDLRDECLNEWIVFVLGPAGTLWEGGVFKALVRFPDGFPMEPFSVQFLVPMHHPNIYRDGKVCLSTLQVPPPDCPSSRLAEFWRPVLGVEQGLLSVVTLLSSPEPSDPANAAAAAQFRTDPAAFAAEVAKTVAQSLKFVPRDFVAPVAVTVVPSTLSSSSSSSSSSASAAAAASSAASLRASERKLERRGAGAGAGDDDAGEEGDAGDETSYRYSSEEDDNLDEGDDEQQEAGGDGGSGAKKVRHGLTAS